jgi:hypothetical protein
MYKYIGTKIITLMLHKDTRIFPKPIVKIIFDIINKDIIKLRGLDTCIDSLKYADKLGNRKIINFPIHFDKQHDFDCKDNKCIYNKSMFQSKKDYSMPGDDKYFSNFDVITKIVYNNNIFFNEISTNLSYFNPTITYLDKIRRQQYINSYIEKYKHILTQINTNDFICLGHKYILKYSHYTDLSGYTYYYNLTSYVNQYREKVKNKLKYVDKY